MIVFFFFLMIRRPPRSTLSSSSAASDVYKRQMPSQAQAQAQAGGYAVASIGRECQVDVEEEVASHLYLVAGQNPMAAIFQGTVRAPVVLHRKRDVVQYVATTVVTAALSFLPSDESDMVPAYGGNQQSADDLRELERMDGGHAAESVCVDPRPQPQWAVTADRYGRVALLALPAPHSKGLYVTRLWKGYRSAKCCLLTLGSKTVLVLYAPRRGLLEAWDLESSNRIFATMLGTQPWAWLGRRSPKTGSCLIMSPGGEIHQLTIQDPHEPISTAPNGSTELQAFKAEVQGASHSSKRLLSLLRKISDSGELVMAIQAIPPAAPAPMQMDLVQQAMVSLELLPNSTPHLAMSLSARYRLLRAFSGLATVSLNPGLRPEGSNTLLGSEYGESLGGLCTATRTTYYQPASLPEWFGSFELAGASSAGVTLKSGSQRSVACLLYTSPSPRDS
eukprot:TRINITY_DN12913_c0_g1_i4.p1 TRINITY_DN12913_c0_g1~~TRINITY_DN12913_c0_g1_i4.p1  ORF type:complete len:448 (-),score=113.38 TRINITY_DN12913_c0_g1_i4:102-1445(-)